MSRESRSESRRSFIRRSALAVGVTAAGGSLAGFKQARAQVWDDPRYDYPWNVDVKEAQITLFLLFDTPLDKLILGTFNATLSSMATKLASVAANSREEGKINAVLNPNNISTLRDRLSNARSRVIATKRSEPYPTTYYEYASTRRQVWNSTGNTSIRSSLEALDQLIPVPPCRVNDDQGGNSPNRDRITPFIQQNRWAIGHFGKNRTLTDLFTTPATDFFSQPNGYAELKLWREARDLGLLWCNPRGANLEEDEKRFVGNEKVCNPQTHKCDEGGPDDYCEEVDGVCNAMGT